MNGVISSAIATTGGITMTEYNQLQTAFIAVRKHAFSFIYGNVADHSR
jgi:hypothetical protein